jgi:hypothetical protein
MRNTYRWNESEGMRGPDQHRRGFSSQLSDPPNVTYIQGKKYISIWIYFYTYHVYHSYIIYEIRSTHVFVHTLLSLSSCFCGLDHHDVIPPHSEQHMLLYTYIHSYMRCVGLYTILNVMKVDKYVIINPYRGNSPTCVQKYMCM